MMREYEFAIIVSGIDPSGNDFEDRLFEAGCDDATLMLSRGAVAVCFIRESEDFAEAVLSACRDLDRAGVIIERLEPDFLVNQSEIAVRANLTRAAISNYVSGERGTDFPPPHARVTTSSPLWDWVDVASWLHAHQAVPAEAVIEARITRAVNLAIQARTGAQLDIAKLEGVLDAAARGSAAA